MLAWVKAFVKAMEKWIREIWVNIMEMVGEGKRKGIV